MPHALDDEESDFGAQDLGLEEDAGVDVNVDMDIVPVLSAECHRA